MVVYWDLLTDIVQKKVYDSVSSNKIMTTIKYYKINRSSHLRTNSPKKVDNRRKAKSTMISL